MSVNFQNFRVLVKQRIRVRNVLLSAPPPRLFSVVPAGGEGTESTLALAENVYLLAFWPVNTFR